MVSRNEIIDRLTEIGEECYSAIEEQKWPVLSYPAKSEANILYDMGLGKYSLKGKKTTISSGNIGEVGTFSRLLWLADLCKKMVKEMEHTSLRGVYYCSMAWPPPIKLRKKIHKQAYMNRLVEVLERMTGVPRESLGIIAEERGSIFGPIKLKIGPRFIDCLSVGKAGLTIPAPQDITIKEVNAEAIIVCEKGETRLRLFKFIPHKLNTVLIHTGGYLNRNTISLIRALYEKTGLPCVMLNDLDFGGLNIYTVAKHYSVTSAHIQKLNLPFLQLLGIRGEDAKTYFKDYEDAFDPAKSYDLTNAKRVLKQIAAGKKQHFMEVKPDLKWIIDEEKLIESPAFNIIGLDATYNYVRDKLKNMGIKT